MTDEVKKLLSVIKQMRDYDMDDLDIDWEEYSQGQTSYTRTIDLATDTLEEFGVNPYL